MWWHTVTQGWGSEGDWRMEWVASTLHTISEHGVSNITTADAHTSAASSRLHRRPCRFKMDSSVSPKDEISFLRVCHHISNAFYVIIYFYWSPLYQKKSDRTKRLVLFRNVRTVAKSACYLRHVYHSTRISAAPTSRIFVKFDVEDFYENPSRKSRTSDFG